MIDRCGFLQVIEEEVARGPGMQRFDYKFDLGKLGVRKLYSDSIRGFSSIVRLLADGEALSGAIMGD